MKPTRQNLLFLVISILFIVGIAIYQLTFPPALNGGVFDPPQPMPDFTLQSVDGPVRLSDSRGKVVILYFGYTFCPDVCPLTLANIRQALSELGADAEKVQVIFVSVDWKRDTPAKTSAYARGFGQNFEGLTGSQPEIDQAIKPFGVYYHINEPDPVSGFFTVEHTSATFVLDGDHNLILTWAYGLTPDKILSDLKILLRR